MILHIYVADKFIPPFINFMNQNFMNEDHVHFIINKKNKFKFPEEIDNCLRIGFRDNLIDEIMKPTFQQVLSVNLITKAFGTNP